MGLLKKWPCACTSVATSIFPSTHGVYAIARCQSLSQSHPLSIRVPNQRHPSQPQRVPRTTPTVSVMDWQAELAGNLHHT
eukprot:14910628-Ditylum_brightwellii.AAC.1